MVNRLSPNPVVLLTVTEFTPSRTEVNDVIREMAAKYPNVQIVDWAASTADEPAFLAGDGLHLSNFGREGLATNVAFALGQAPVTPGKCLATSFTDDSGGPVTGTTLKPGSVTPTTKKPATGSTTASTTATPAGDTVDTGSVEVTTTTVKATSSSSSTVTTKPPTSTTATPVTDWWLTPPALPVVLAVGSRHDGVARELCPTSDCPDPLRTRARIRTRFGCVRTAAVHVMSVPGSGQATTGTRSLDRLELRRALGRIKWDARPTGRVR